MCQISVVNINGKKKAVIFPDIWKKARSMVYSGMAVKLEGEHQISGDFIVAKGMEA